MSNAFRHKKFLKSLARYRSGEWRAPIFRDLIADDVRPIGPNCTILDIGCGNGFDDDHSLQKSLATLSGQFIGVEPDPTMQVETHFTEMHRCLFQDANIGHESIDLAYAVMVLEHLENPQNFWTNYIAC